MILTGLYWMILYKETVAEKTGEKLPEGDTCKQTDKQKNKIHTDRFRNRHADIQTN